MTPKMNVSRLAPFLQSVLRIVAAVVFLMHGTQKLFGFPVGTPVRLNSLLGAAGLLEVIGGTLLLAGLFTRPVAFVLAGHMAVAYFIRHYPQGRWPIVNGGELAVLFCFIWLYFFAAGPGPISLDALLGRRAR
jgi:putative oxidoreductase